MAEQLARVAQVSEVMGEQDALLRHTFDEHQASLSLAIRRTVNVFYLTASCDLGGRVTRIGWLSWLAELLLVHATRRATNKRAIQTQLCLNPQRTPTELNVLPRQQITVFPSFKQAKSQP